MDELWVAARKIKDIITKTPGADYVEFSTKSLKTEVNIKLDRDKIAKMGLNIPAVGAAIQLAFRGNDQSKFKDNGEDYAINIMYDKADKKNIQNLANTTLQTPQGAIIRLQASLLLSELNI